MENPNHPKPTHAIKLTQLNKNIVLSRKVEWLEDMRAAGRSPDQQVALLLEMEGIKVHRSTFYRLDRAYGEKGIQRNLRRAKRVPKMTPDEAAARENRQKQLDYLWGHMYARKQGLARAHEDLVQYSQYFGWGDPLSMHAAYHAWEAIPKFDRDAITKDREKHYTKHAAYAVARKFKANQGWQADEFEFTVLDEKKNIVKIHAVAWVDRATGLALHVELSLHPINSVSFIRSFKQALLPNPDFGVSFCKKPKVIQVDNISFHEPPSRKEKRRQFEQRDEPETTNLKPEIIKAESACVRDFRSACEELNIRIHFNAVETPRQNAMVENFNGNFKRQFAKEFAYFVQEVAPAHTSEEWVTHLKALPDQMKAYCYKRNTQKQKDGSARLEKYISGMIEDSMEITADQIDKAVRITVPKISFGQYGITWDEKNHYDHHDQIKRVRDIMIRVRPEGPGPDVEAYEDGVHIGRLWRVEDHPHMAEAHNTAYKKEMAKLAKQNQELAKRFLGYSRQVNLMAGARPPEQQQLIRNAEKRESAPSSQAAPVQSQEEQPLEAETLR